MFKSKWILHFWQAVLLAVIFVAWWALTKPGLIPPFIFENDTQAAFFFGEPVEIFHRIWDWFFVNHEIYEHLAVTLWETVLAFAIGTVSGLIVGLWLGLSPRRRQSRTRSSRGLTPARA